MSICRGHQGSLLTKPPTKIRGGTSLTWHLGRPGNRALELYGQSEVDGEIEGTWRNNG